MVVPVNDDVVPYCNEVAKKMRGEPLKCCGVISVTHFKLLYPVRFGLKAVALFPLFIGSFIA
eukprot:1429670-Rhodomonas_salina.1